MVRKINPQKNRSEKSGLGQVLQGTVMDDTDHMNQASGASSKDKNSSRSILTPPSKDEEHYLSEIEREGGKYDPKTVVGGPSRS
jgi:hypothetical protein